MGKQRINDEIYREEGAFYRTDKPKTITLCNPTDCGGELLTKDNEFINLKNIKQVCDCVNKSLCIQFLQTGDRKILDEIK